MSDDLVSTLRVVSVLDPALDRVAMDVVRYAETRDPDLIVELPGQHARVAELAPLAVDQVGALDSLSAPAAKLVQSFRMACRAIHHFSSSSPGMAVRPTERVRMGHADVVTWSQPDIELVLRELGMAYLYEIGTVAYERAIQGKAFGGSAYYTLPQSSVLGLGLIARHLAGRVSTTVGTSSSERSAPESTRTPPQSSAPATDAGATAPTDNPAASPAPT